MEAENRRDHGLELYVRSKPPLGGGAIGPLHDTAAYGKGGLPWKQPHCSYAIALTFCDFTAAALDLA